MSQKMSAQSDVAKKYDTAKMENLAIHSAGNEPSESKSFQDTNSGGSLRARTVGRKLAKRKAQATEDGGLVAVICAGIVRHQIGIAINLLLLLNLTHLCFPKARQYTAKISTMSYYNDATGRYGVGWDDAFYVAFWTTIMIGLRVFIMDYMATPLAQYLGLGKKDCVRFAEQSWQFLYFMISFPVGMYIFYSSAYWNNFRELWTNWPDREMDSLFKNYYLIQFAWWIQQIAVLNLEDKRKDHYQMLTHHIVTCALILGSYVYRYVKVGNVILCIMDAVDVVFPFAKMLKYLKHQKSCDAAFGVFMLTWFGGRHIVYSFILKSIYYDYLDIATFGCFIGTNEDLQGPLKEPNQWAYLFAPLKDPRGMICQNSTTTYSFVFLLLFLQAIMIMWFFMIIRVAVKVIRGQGADDVRSDDEDETEETEIDVEEGPYIEVPPLEEEVGVEGINFAAKKGGSSKKTNKRGHASASGVSLSSDKKELLGRIGCDKGA